MTRRGAGREVRTPTAPCLTVPVQKERGVGGLRLLKEGSESPPEGREEGTDQRSRSGTSGGPAALGNSEVQSPTAAGKQTRRPRGWQGRPLCQEAKRSRSAGVSRWRVGAWPEGRALRAGSSLVWSALGP